MKPPTLHSYHQFATDDTILYCSCGRWRLEVNYGALEMVVDKPHVVEMYLMEHMVVGHGMTPDKAYDAVIGWGGWQ